MLSRKVGIERRFFGSILAISLQFASYINRYESSLPSHYTNDLAIFIPRAVRVRITSTF